MKEQRGDIWAAAGKDDADALVITTNGIVKKDGTCVMGRGIAKQARDGYPGVDKLLGERIQKFGNRVFLLQKLWPGDTHLVSFPVKHHWKSPADLTLIDRSTKQLYSLADAMGWEKIYIPRPGCGNGGLHWGDVKPILARVFDHRFTVFYL